MSTFFFVQHKTAAPFWDMAKHAAGEMKALGEIIFEKETKARQCKWRR